MNLFTKKYKARQDLLKKLEEKDREILEMERKNAVFAAKTLSLLLTFGMSQQEIFDYYMRQTNEDRTF